MSTPAGVRMVRVVGGANVIDPASQPLSRFALVGPIACHALSRRSGARRAAVS